MSACDYRTTFPDFVLSPAENLLHHGNIKAGRETKQIHRHGGNRTHRIDVGKGVCCGHLPERIGIIYHRREEIHRFDRHGIPLHLIDQCVITRLKTFQQPIIAHLRKTGKHIMQFLWIKFRGTSTRLHHAGQFHHHACLHRQVYPSSFGAYTPSRSGVKRVFHEGTV